MARRTVLGGGAAALAMGAFPFPAGAASPSDGLPASKEATFATDIRLPGLLQAVVARPPLPGWRLAGFDDAATRRMDRVVGLIRLEPTFAGGIVRLGGVAVLARDTWAALRARDALRPVWEETAEIGGEPAQSFFVPETAEPLMEPPSATVRAGRDRCAVWTRTRDPRRLRQELSALLGLAPDAVALHPTPSACGQDVSNPAYAVEAALLSRAMGGAPVSLAWTAADDLPFRHRAAWA
ncbi:hypothetical protein [Methylobacterium sp. WL9]|uniref:hypothetical protein n=1 Tax=Methylobacterium sp. WL9 TaxID=2603898 RepID=UPI0011CC4A6E|nr:hypothetical protein [Methylobacterium sp. WL9]TXN22709.1 hypothetical protein FV217_09800 [Methylobacterium sp. WL9]